MNREVFFIKLMVWRHTENSLIIIPGIRRKKQV
jgi:hypothetical protein